MIQAKKKPNTLMTFEDKMQAAYSSTLEVIINLQVVSYNLIFPI